MEEELTMEELTKRVEVLEAKVEKLESAAMQRENLRAMVYLNDVMTYFLLKLTHLLHVRLLATPVPALHLHWFGPGKPFRSPNQRLDFAHLLFFLQDSPHAPSPHIQATALCCCQDAVALAYQQQAAPLGCRPLTGAWLLASLPRVLCRLLPSAKAFGLPGLRVLNHMFVPQPQLMSAVPISLLTEHWGVLGVAQKMHARINTDWDSLMHLFKFENPEADGKIAHTIHHIASALLISDCLCKQNVEFQLRIKEQYCGV